MPAAPRPAVRPDPHDDPETVEFVLRLAMALHTAGVPSPSLEDTLVDISERLNLEAQFFSTPTSLMAAFGPLARQRTHLLRVAPGGTDLGRLSDLHAVAGEVQRGELQPGEGTRRIEAILAANVRYRQSASVAASGLASTVGAAFLGGTINDALLAGIIGLAIGVLHLAFRRVSRDEPFELLAAFVASLGVTAAVTLGYRASVPTSVLASLIVLLPGLSVTVAMAELGARHLASGTARLSSAFINLIMLTLGVALGTAVATAIWGAAPVVRAPRPPEWLRYAALSAAPLAFIGLLNARARDAIWVVVACVLGYAGLVAGQEALGTVLGASVGALTVGLAANAFERFNFGPAQVPLVPGVLLLVPGSLGFRSLTAMLDENFDTGVSTGFTMILTAVALAAGLLVANVVLPARRGPRRASETLERGAAPF